MGGIFLFIGLFFLVESDLLGSSINLFVISISILFGKMLSEIFQTRFYQLSIEEKKRIGSFERWLESFKQLGQILTLFGKSSLNFFQSLRRQSEKPFKEKKWVHPALKEEIEKKVVDQSDTTDSNKMRNQELNEKEETS
tara:strand:- start:528 stop:944 length:417 start_codon:yes stop_codon:yes gene_type:complete